MKTYQIDNLHTKQWNKAIEETAKTINVIMGTHFTSDDWDKLERLAMKFNIRFSEDGEISK